jgi:preprotein translocase SecE subunit
VAREADAGRPPAPRGQARPAGEVEHHHHRFGFIRESWAELKKVEWPGQSQVIQGTVVVLIACAIVGVYLYANDLVWKRVVQNVFLGQ